MKLRKIIALALTLALMLTCLVGCTGANKAIKEIGASYVQDEYYPEQLEEIDAIISDYTARINEAKNKEEVEALKAECLAAIDTVELKQEAMDNAAAELEEFYRSVSLKVLPYDAAMQYAQLKYELAPQLDSPKTAGDIRKAIASMNEIVGEYTNTASCELTKGGMTLGFDVEYTIDEDGNAIIDLSCSENWDEFAGLEAADTFYIVTATYTETSLDWPNPDHMIGWNKIYTGFYFEHLTYHCEEHALNHMLDADPAYGRVTLVDENTMSLLVAPSELIEKATDDSETFITPHGKELPRVDGFAEINNDFISVTIMFGGESQSFNNSTPFVIML